MDIKPGSRIHFMGICGTAMASLAGIMQSKGFKITGSDQNVYPPMSTQLEALGIPIMESYKKENLSPRPDLVIVGNVMTRKHEEAQALLASDIPYTSLPKAMGEYVIENRNSIVVSGTHGKTTTTSMLATVVEACHPGVGFLIGGIPANFKNSFRAPQNNWFVIEGDEYDTAFFDKVPKFIYYKPKYVVLTSVEFDHADIYKDLEDVKKAFRQLLELIPKDGICIANGDDKNIREMLPLAKCKVFTYGVSKDCDYRIVDRQNLVGRNQFSVQKNGKSLADIAIKSPGEFNALNALASYALAHELKFSEAKVLQALADFKGVKRRQELLGEPGGISVIEDFAHHPTAVEKTIGAIRELYIQPKSSQKLFALFEPRSATSRRKVFQKDYVEALKGADYVLISQAHDQSNIAEEDRFSSSQLVDDLKSKGVDTYLYKDVDPMVEFVKSKAKKGDVVLVMSNGAFGGIYTKILKALS